MRTKEQSRTPVAGIVGRWQVDDLHEGHHALIREVLRHHQKVVVFIGAADFFRSRRDPLDYPTRAAMLLHHYPQTIVLPIADHISDQVWSQNLDRLLRTVAPVGDAILYGGRDSFIQHYTGRFPTIELDALYHPSGTEIRESVSRVVRQSPDFRAGVIYGEFNRFSQSLQVVDIAVLRSGEKGGEVLLGSKKHEEGLRFPGGFVDPTDISLESAARRELAEETGADISVDSLRYLGSFRIPDPRVGPGDSMLSAFFLAHFQFGRVQASDDLAHVGWIPLGELGKVQMVPSHEELREALLSHLK